MNAKNVLIASAVAMLFVTGAVNARADQSAGRRSGEVRRWEQLQGTVVLQICAKRLQGQERLQRTRIRPNVHAGLQGQGRYSRSAGQQVDQ